MSISNDLRQAVLQAAIQGKLTKQLPEDGNAKDLLEQIKAEKAKLVKEGKLKKEKPLPEITEEEKPFEIPENWEWVRMGAILEKFTDGTHKTPKYTTKGIPFLSVKDISGGEICFDECRYISEEEHKELYFRCNPEYGDILLTKVGTTGIPVVVDESREFSLFVSVALLKFNKNLLNNKFLTFLLKSPLVQEQAAENTRGVGNKNWVMKDIANTIISMPPHSEQKRIVAKVEELMAKIDELEKTEKELDALKKAFPADMKASLLQAAIQGKLTEQLPEDGNAKDLLEQIKAEKAKLVVKEGKLKKEKPLPEITEDEIPFDIPENWEWVKLNKVAFVTKLAGFEYTKDIAPNLSVDGIPLFKGKNVQDGHLVYEFEAFIPESISDSLERSQLRKPCLLTPYVGTLGNIAIFDGSFKAHLGSNVGKIELISTNVENIELGYLLYYLLSPFGLYQLGKHSKKTAQASISIEAIRDVIVAMPPVAEQKRIVEKLDKLLPMCDGLK